MPRLLLLFIPFLLCAWQEYKEIDNIRIYKKHDKKFKFVQFKADLLISSSIEQVSRVILDTRTYTSWLSDCIEAKPLEENIYLRMQPPWPLNQRQVIAKLEVQDYGKRRKISLISLNEHSTNSSAIWFNYLYAEFILEQGDNNQTKVTLSLLGDPGGYPPSWIVNLMAWKIPYQSLRDLNIYLQKSKIQ